MKKDSIILFDGKCNLCNKSVQYILLNDKKAVFKFASLQSKTGQDFLTKHKLNTQNFDTFILYIPSEGYYIKSTAFLKVFSTFGIFQKFIATVFMALPEKMLFPFYEFVAKNRYKWFGKNESCMLPKPEWKDRFLN